MDNHPQFKIDWYKKALGLINTGTTDPLIEGHDYKLTDPSEKDFTEEQANEKKISFVVPPYSCQLVVRRGDGVVDVHTFTKPGDSKIVYDAPPDQVTILANHAIITRKS